jgi:hypothetical protein
MARALLTRRELGRTWGNSVSRASEKRSGRIHISPYTAKGFAMADATHCPHCLAVCPPGGACQNCQLGGARLAPRFVPLPRDTPAPTPTPEPAEPTYTPHAFLAALLGMLGFAMAWAPALRPFAAVLAGVGVILGVALFLQAKSRGWTVSGLPLAAGLVSLQGLIVALVLLPRPAPIDDPAVATIPGPVLAEPEKPRDQEPTEPDELAALRQAREKWKAEAKLDAALAACLPRLGHADAAVREAAAGLVRELGAPAVPELAPLLKHDDQEKRRSAARALAALGPAAKNELNALHKVMMGDPDAAVRLHAAKAVHAITLQTKIVAPALRRCLDDADPAVRNDAAEALKQIEARTP